MQINSGIFPPKVTGPEKMRLKWQYRRILDIAQAQSYINLFYFKFVEKIHGLEFAKWTLSIYPRMEQQLHVLI